MNDKPKTKLRWRLFRWGLIGLAGLATLAAILITEENWRGKRDWQNYKHEAEARGERLDIASVIPPTVPDDQNFFCAPIVAEALKWHRNEHTDASEAHIANIVNRMNFNIYPGDVEHSPGNGNWQKGTLTDFKQWQRYYQNYAATPEGKTNGLPVASQPQTPAADIMLALSVFDPATEELRQAAARPYARMPVNYEDGFGAAGTLLPWLATTKRCGQFLQLRILAELQNGQSEQALADLKLLFRVTDNLRSPRFLISQLVRNAIIHIALQPVYEGLAQHRWTDAQLAELERELAKEDLLADFASAMTGEKVCAIDAFEKQRLTREIKEVDDSSGTNQIVTIKLRWLPDGYFYQNQLAFARLHQEFIVPLIDFTNRIVAPAALRAAKATVAARLKHYSPYQIQALATLPAIAGSVMKFAQLQSALDLARVACVLERYRLANGNYPETLGTLAPQVIEKLPHDIINGQPLHYRRTDDGKFLLYSVGWDEKDDGGQIFLTKGGSVDQKKGDLVWKY